MSNDRPRFVDVNVESVATKTGADFKRQLQSINIDHIIRVAAGDKGKAILIMIDGTVIQCADSQATIILNIGGAGISVY